MALGSFRFPTCLLHLNHGGPCLLVAFAGAMSVCLEQSSPASPSLSLHPQQASLFCPMQALVIAGISLQAANLYGYVLCKMGGDGDMSTVAASFLPQTVFQTVSDESLRGAFLPGAQ